MYLEILCLGRDGQVLQSDDWRRASTQDLLVPVTSEKIAQLVAGSELRYARFQPLATVLNLLVCQGFDFDSRAIDKDRTGVISINGPHNLTVANEFSMSLVEKGTGGVNPIQFPYTLQSSIACEIAACYGFGAMAMSVGHNRHAFRDALLTAADFLHSGMMDQVLLLAGGILQPYYRPAREPFHAIAICALMSTVNVTKTSVIRIAEQGAGTILWPAQEQTSGRWEEALEELPLAGALRLLENFKH